MENDTSCMRIIKMPSDYIRLGEELWIEISVPYDAIVVSFEVPEMLLDRLTVSRIRCGSKEILDTSRKLRDVVEDGVLNEIMIPRGTSILLVVTGDEDTRIEGMHLFAEAVNDREPIPEKGGSRPPGW